jgi:hypothetical protein
MGVVNGTGSEDAWQRELIVEITDGTSTMTYHNCANVNIEGGSRAKSKIELCNLGQIPRHEGTDPITITFEGYPRFAGTAAAGAVDGIWEIYADSPVTDASQPLAISASNTLTKYRVTLLWTDDSSATSASGTTAASTNADRVVIAECFAMGCPIDFTDRIRKETLSFWGVVFDASASANLKRDSGKATALTALTGYAPGTTKW